MSESSSPLLFRTGILFPTIRLSVAEESEEASRVPSCCHHSPVNNRKEDGKKAKKHTQSRARRERLGRRGNGNVVFHSVGGGGSENAEPLPQNPPKSQTPLTFLCNSDVVDSGALVDTSTTLRESPREAGTSPTSSRPGMLVITSDALGRFVMRRATSSTAHTPSRASPSVGTVCRGRVGPIDDEGYYDMILPCGLNQEEIIDIMYRDINPEDFEALSKLDEGLPKRSIAGQSLVEKLSHMTALECGVTECGVCLAETGPKSIVVKLPCGHGFHPPCISKWLTQCKNCCPFCAASLKQTVII